MKAWTIGSGSRGNAIVLETGGTYVAIDDGYSPRELTKRLASVGITPQAISAVIVTHEHIDHIRGVGAAQRKWGWHVFATAGTLGGIGELDMDRATTIRAGEAFAIGAFMFDAIRVPHDASAPISIVATAAQTGFRTGVAHDLGAIPEPLRAAFAGLDLLLLESNHDEEMLRNGPYPPFLQSRITGGSGHLSNRKSAAFARDLAGPSLREIVLLHLSEVNNSPRHAVAATVSALTGARATCPVTAAPQDRAAGPFGVGGRAAIAAEQFQLAL